MCGGGSGARGHSVSVWIHGVAVSTLDVLRHAGTKQGLCYLPSACLPQHSIGLGRSHEVLLID